MSYGGMVLRLSFERLRNIMGSRAQDLVDKLSPKLKLDDEDFMDDEDEEEDEEPIPLPSEALRQIIMGEDLVSYYPESYGAALLVIYHHIGQLLDNSEVFPVAWDFIIELDSALAAEGIPEPVRLATLFSRGLPFLHIDPPEPFPIYGYLTLEEVDSAQGRLAGVKWSKCDSALHPALQQFTSWLNQAGRERQGLVGYYG